MPGKPDIQEWFEMSLTFLLCSYKVRAFLNVYYVSLSDSVLDKVTLTQPQLYKEGFIHETQWHSINHESDKLW